VQAARERTVAWIVGIEVAILGLLGRRWVRNQADPLVWNDSADYLAAAQEALWSRDRLAGTRPVLLPLVLSAAGSDLERLTTIHTVVAAVAWGLLAGVAASTLVGTWRPLVAGSTILVLSLTWPLSMWDQQVLTESLALSTLVLVAAAGISFARDPSSPWRTAALVAAGWAWLLARDSHVVPLAMVGIGLGVLAWRSVGARRLVLGLGGAYLLALCLLTVGSARHGGRDQVPLEHVYVVRILPYEDRVAAMADRGMPDEATVLALPEYVDPSGDQAPITLLNDDPSLDRWRRWLATDGRTALAAYAATHPGYLFEGLRHPERVFNNAGGIGGYAPLEQRDLPLPDGLANPSTLAVVLLGLLGAGVAVIRGVGRHPLLLVGAVLSVTAAPHALLVWHSDGMEAARHLLIPSTQLRLGVLLIVLAAALASGTGAAPAAEDAPVEGAPDEAIAVGP
jgi:hypothetical protein